MRSSSLEIPSRPLVWLEVMNKAYQQAGSVSYFDGKSQCITNFDENKRMQMLQPILIHVRLPPIANEVEITTDEG
ncbi:hypothetical protein X801_08009, partial [Opisthorchis viverrini]